MQDHLGFGNDDHADGDDCFNDRDENWKNELSSQVDPMLSYQSNNKAQPLNYARTSKKVDIKLLKDNIWKNMESSGVENKSNIEFTKMMDNLGKQYEQKEWTDISVQFCFICLLHLANENGLEVMGNIRDGQVSEELVIRQI